MKRGPFVRRRSRRRMLGDETAVKNLHLVGYGNWAGEASATLMGVGSFVEHSAQVARAVSMKLGSTPNGCSRYRGR
ncbi:hypothetical protein PQG76_08905 [Corynebacterium falsenii]|uniref:hypothetical protein n=1 Tax=Corynebacterium falsenii TaxID=108486 RepID=UPI00234CB0A1|nr:hypothetical protein [Corynebacterium falsenii]MDC7104621.1 hypothetical protein [Corynebacterium falsenii]